jgi:hypothetical protein
LFSLSEEKRDVNPVSVNENVWAVAHGPHPDGEASSISNLHLSKSKLFYLSMNSPHTPVALPVDYATEIAIEMHLMRSECIDAARALMTQTQPDEAALENCARLDDALAKAHAILQAALQRVKPTRVK